MGNDCPIEHSRISLKKASQIHCAELNELLWQTCDILKKYKEAVVTTNCVRKELEIHSQLGKELLKKSENDYVQQVRDMFQKFRAEIHELKVERMTALDQKRSRP